MATRPGWSTSRWSSRPRREPARTPWASPGAGRAGESRGSLRSSLLCFLGGFGVALIKAKSCQLSSRVFCSALGSPSSRGLVARSISWRRGKPARTSCHLRTVSPRPHPMLRGDGSPPVQAQGHTAPRRAPASKTRPYGGAMNLWLSSCRFEVENSRELGPRCLSESQNH